MHRAGVHEQIPTPPSTRRAAATDPFPFWVCLRRDSRAHLTPVATRPPPRGPRTPISFRARSPRVSGTPFPRARGHCPGRPLRNPGTWRGPKWGPSLHYSVQASPLLGCPAPGRPRTQAGVRVGRAAGLLAQRRPRCPAQPQSSAKASSPPQGTERPASCCLARNAVHPAGPAWASGLTALTRGEFILPRAHFTECWHRDQSVRRSGPQGARLGGGLAGNNGWL